MPEEFKPGCQRPPIKKVNVQTEEIARTHQIMKVSKQSMVKVGKPAPDFTFAAFVQVKCVITCLS